MRNVIIITVRASHLDSALCYAAEYFRDMAKEQVHPSIAAQFIWQADEALRIAAQIERADLIRLER